MNEKNTKEKIQKEQNLDFKPVFDIIEACKSFSEVSLSVERDKISLHFKNNQENSADFSFENQQIQNTEVNELDDDFTEEKLNKLKAEHALTVKEQLVFDDPVTYMTGEDSPITDNEWIWKKL